MESKENPESDLKPDSIQKPKGMRISIRKHSEFKQKTGSIQYSECFLNPIGIQTGF